MTETTSEQGGGGAALVIGMVVMAGLGAVVGGLQSSSEERPEVFTKQAPQTLVKQLEDPTEAARAGFKLLDQGKASIPPLLRAAQDPAFRARRRAIDLLGQLRAKEAIPLLVELKEPELAEDRIVGLGRIQGPRALAEVRKVLEDEQAPIAVQIAAVRAAAGWESPPADLDDAIEPFQRHEVWGLREFAALYYGSHKRKGAVPALISLLKDPNASVRRRAAWALMQIKDPAGVRAVDDALAAGAIPPDDD